LVGSVYEGMVTANIAKTVEFNSPTKVNGVLFFRLSVGDKSVNGKVTKID
jgi:hypothetical protein